MQKRQELSAAFENEVIHGKGSGNGKWSRIRLALCSNLKSLPSVQHIIYVSFVLWMWPAADLIKRYQEEARVMQQIFKGPLGAQSLAMLCVFFYFSPNQPFKSPILSRFLLYAYRWQLCVQYIMCIWRFPEIGVPPFMEPPIYNYIYIHTYIHPSKGSFTALSTVTLALQSLPTNRDNLEYRINLIPYLEIYLKYPQGGNRSPND